MSFKIGDKAYFPAQGVGVVKKVETKEISGVKQSYYVVEVLSSGAKLMVPANSMAAKRSGMRSLICESEIQNVMTVLKTPKKVANTTWNRRFRDYNERLKTGSAVEVAGIIRELYTLQANKELSFGEKNMLEKARSLIVEEIKYARNHEESNINNELDRILI